MIYNETYNNFVDRIFSIDSEAQFNSVALEIFYIQYNSNEIYRQFVDYLGVKPEKVSSVESIPFMPIDFFKYHKIVSGNRKTEKIFKSSSTTGKGRSSHIITDLSVYRKSFLSAFGKFYGNPSDYCFLALLPSYVEQGESSLIFMIDELITLSENRSSGYYLDDFEDITTALERLKNLEKKVILWGVTYSLLDLVEYRRMEYKNLVVIETGGMKGRRKEMIRNELHSILKTGFGVENIHSEYGMTEMLSQAYSGGNGVFYCPNTMRVLIRDANDPFAIIETGKTGGINVIDLANINSCSFIATQDLGKLNADGGFEVVGRFDSSDVRGCNLLVG